MKKKAIGRSATARKTSAGTGKSKSPRRPTNLTLDAEAVARGERFSEAQGTSLSSLVTSLLYALPGGEPTPVREPLPPAVGRLYGVARGADAEREEYRAHLVHKYGRQT